MAISNLLHAPLSTAVNLVLLALGTASIALLLLAGDQFSKVISRDAQGIDLVLGAKGSPVQLVLSSVYHVDIPTGNIPLRETHRWTEDPRVSAAVPLSLGDSYQGFRVVGTTPEYAKMYAAELAKGTFWRTSMQAVVGAAVAREAMLSLGSQFAGSHGFTGGGHQHAQKPYTVVGILQATGTVLDRLILTSLESVWKLHGIDDTPSKEGDPSQHAPHDSDAGHDEGHSPTTDSHQTDSHAHDSHADIDDDKHPEKEITAILIRYASPMAAVSLPRQVNNESRLQAASPAYELSRLLHVVGMGLDGLFAFSGVLIFTAGFSIFAALYGALHARRFDLAMLRCLGATRSEIVLGLVLEGLILCAVGAMLGLALGHLVMMAMGAWLEASRGVVVSGLIWLPQENFLLLGMLVLGLFASALPAWQACRIEVSQTLTQG